MYSRSEPGGHVVQGAVDTSGDAGGGHNPQRRLGHDKALVDAVAAHKRSRPSLCVAWDGDAPSDESFTRLLRRCASLGCDLIAFCYAGDEAAFRKAWGPEGLAIRGYVVDEPPDDVACRWAFLGVSALRATRATECLCLGGGPVALREFEASAAAFVLYEVSRRPRDGAGAPERSALLERAPHDRLRVVASDEPPRPPPPPNADVVVKTSRLPGAGLGLFAVRAFAVGELVCEYTGTVLDSAARSLEDKSYLMRLGEGVYACGDWVDRTGHASWSTEKAVVTGRQAAAAVGRSLGLRAVDAQVIPAAEDTPQLAALRKIAAALRAVAPTGTALPPPAPWAALLKAVSSQR